MTSPLHGLGRDAHQTTESSCQLHGAVPTTLAHWMSASSCTGGCMQGCALNRDATAGFSHMLFC
jgi:hypothetical protein